MASTYCAGKWSTEWGKKSQDVIFVLLIFKLRNWVKWILVTNRPFVGAICHNREARGTRSTSSALSILSPSSSTLVAGYGHGTNPPSHTDCKWNFPSVIGDSSSWFSLAITLSFAVICRQSAWFIWDLCLEFHFINSSHFYRCLFPLPHICPLGLAQLKINICNQLCLYGNSYTGWMVEQTGSR